MDNERTPSQIVDREQGAKEIADLERKLEDFKRQNDLEHKSIIDNQRAMGGKIDHLSETVNDLTGRIDSFLLAQSTNYTATIDALCKHVDGKWQVEMTATKSDVARTDEKVRNIQNIMFGHDKEGGLLAKVGGMTATIKALWLVNSALFTIDMALIGYLVYLRF